MDSTNRGNDKKFTIYINEKNNQRRYKVHANQIKDMIMIELHIKI